MCSGQQIVEIQCTVCGVTKGIEEFAKSQRADSDTARCLRCTAKREQHDPNIIIRFDDPLVHDWTPTEHTSTGQTLVNDWTATDNTSTNHTLADHAPAVDIPAITMPAIDMPAVEIPAVDTSVIDMPAVDISADIGPFIPD